MSIPSYSPPKIRLGRLTALALIPVFGAIFVTVRLVHLGTFGGEEYRKRAERQHFRSVQFPELRGRLLDADQHELASSTFVETLYVRPHLLFARSAELSRVADVVTSLSRALQMPEEELFDALETTRTVVLKRRMPLTQARAVRSVLTSASLERLDRRGTTLVDSRGWWMRKETIRSYTRGEFAPHVIGYTIPNDKGDALGLDGVERSYNEVLNATTATARIRQTALGTGLTPVDPAVLENSFGSNVVLTLVTPIQKAAEQAIAAQVQAFRAESGVVVVVDPKTGAILAMANVPTFDLNARPGTSDLQRRNRAIADGYEPGSVMKTFTYLAAIEEGKIRASSTINCEGGTWVYRGRTIRDAGRRHGVTNAATAFADSSNVGAVKVALQLSKTDFHRHLTRMGFGRRTGVDLPGESPGLLFPVSRWSDQSIQSLAFGYEMRATALQIAMAGAAIANDGLLMKPFVVKELLDHRGEVTSRTQPTIVNQIASPRACKELLTMMAQTVSDGTGKAAQLDGWTAGGKTGTTKLVDPLTRRYASNLYVSSFLGVAPLENPRVVIYVSVRRPDPSIGSGGGAVAAPVFKVVAEAAMRALRVPPSPNATIARPSADEVRDRLMRELKGRVPGPELERVLARDQEPDLQPLGAGFMPDLTGLCLRDAARVVASLGWELEIEGSGIVTEQWPRPLERLEPSVRVRLRLAPMEQRLAEIARRAGTIPELAHTGPGLLAQARAEEAHSETIDDEPLLKLQRGNKQVELTLTPVADTVAARSPLPPQSPISEFPAGEEATAAADLDPPTPGLGTRIWNEYFQQQAAASAESDSR